MKRQITQFQNGQRIWIDISPKNIQKVNEHKKRCSTSLIAAAAKSLQSCLIGASPELAAHQAPPSLGFSRQEHWSGLPFPSPMHESEKWKWSRSVVSDPSQRHGLQSTRLLCPWDSPGESTGVECYRLLRKGPLQTTNSTLFFVWGSRSPYRSDSFKTTPWWQVLVFLARVPPTVLQEPI